MFAGEGQTTTAPVVPGDHPDPSLLRTAGGWYATATSGTWLPAFPMLHSADLQDWRQVGSVLIAMVLITIIDVFLFRKAKMASEVRWGKIPPVSQYVLIFIAVTFTWLMGLMGYVRSGLRQHWHVYGVVRDTSVDAFTPTLGFATKVVSVTVLAFFVLIGFVFWLASMHDKKDWGSEGVHPHKGHKEIAEEMAS